MSERGPCDGCARWFALNKDGTVRKHERGRGRFEFASNPPKYVPNYCPGSNKPPREKA